MFGLVSDLYGQISSGVVFPQHKLDVFAFMSHLEGGQLDMCIFASRKYEHIQLSLRKGLMQIELVRTVFIIIYILEYYLFLHFRSYFRTAAPILIPNKLQNCIYVFYMLSRFYQNQLIVSKVITSQTYVLKVCFLPPPDYFTCSFNNIMFMIRDTIL